MASNGLNTTSGFFKPSDRKRKGALALAAALTVSCVSSGLARAADDAATLPDQLHLTPGVEDYQPAKRPALMGIPNDGPTTSSSASGELVPAPQSMKVDPSFFGPARLTRVSNPTMGEGPTEHPVFLAQGPGEDPEKPNIHGFVEVPFKNSYVTPRGLYVENSGVVIQPVGGLIFPIGDVGPLKGFTFVTGVWNSINSNQGDPNVGPWNEMDFFASFSGNIDKFSITMTYGAWNFPQSTATNKPSTEHNIDWKISYDDSKLFGDGWFALHPYVDIFWAVSGSSTVVLGKQGNTGYVEVGIVPTYTYKEITNYPLTFSFPIYVSVGPEDYWGDAESGGKGSGNAGVFSASANVSVPLNFIPARLGYWHADAGFTYYYLINDNLLHAGTILSGNTDRNVYQGSVGIGVNF